MSFSDLLVNFAVLNTKSSSRKNVSCRISSYDFIQHTFYKFSSNLFLDTKKTSILIFTKEPINDNIMLQVAC